MKGPGLLLEDALLRGRVTAGGVLHPVPGGMLETAENLRRQYSISRQEQDEYAVRSHERAAAAIDGWLFDEELVPVTVVTRKGEVVVTEDEHVRRDSSVAAMSRLRPLLETFDPEATVTAGNASGQNDGASLCVVPPDKAAELGLRPLVRLVAWSGAGVALKVMGIGRGARYGLETMCIGGGQGMAALFELVDRDPPARPEHQVTPPGDPVKTAVIVDAIRTPSGRGKAGGALSGVHPIDLLGGVLEQLVERTGIDPAQIEDVITGCAQQIGEQSGNIGHNASLAAGFPESVPGTTINRQCGSGQQAATFAAQGVMADGYDVVIAAGIEMMSSVPLGSSRPQSRGARTAARYPDGLVNQGVSAELVAAQWKLDRDDLDEYAARSHQRAAQAWVDGHFVTEVVPVATPDGPHSTDETIRGGTTVEGLAALKPSFRTEEMAARFPQIGWSVTAGNSSPITDGASAVLIMSEERAHQLGLRPRARFHAFSVVGDDPLMMLTGPIPATRKVLERSGMTLEQIDAYEVNEAFASVPLAWARALNADPARMNPRGGAIALGHPLGSSGTRLLVTLLHHLEATGGRYGLQTMCEAGGMANATIIERL